MSVEAVPHPSRRNFASGIHVAWAILLCVAWSVTAAHARPTVMVTVDVESFDTAPLPGQLNAHCEDHVPCGLGRIMQMLEERQLRGTFFLNVYEQAAWGEAALKELTLEMQRRGHDVALHTHPQWAYDAQRPYMYSYSPDDQKRIVADGVRLLEDWTGLPVVAHRAGAYSADRATVHALQDGGVVFDSSLFLDHPHSHLNGLGLPSNVPSMIDSVMEIPVTVYWRHERPRFGGLLPPHVAIGKLDVDSIGSTEEAVAAFDAVVQADPPIIVLFLHSFSLMTVSAPEPTAAAADMQSIDIYATLLDRIAAHGLKVVTSRDVVEQRDLAPMDRHDLVPAVALTVPVRKYAVRMVRSRPLACAVFGLACATVLAVAVIAWRRRGRRLPARS